MMWKYLHNAAQMFTQRKKACFSNRSSVEAAMTGRRCMFLGKSKSTLFGLQKVMHLGIIKITYNRTITHFMDDSFVNLGDEVIHAMWAITTDSKVC